MSTRSKVAVLALGSLLAAWAQNQPANPYPASPRSVVKIDLPADSPLTVVSADWGESRTEARGGALVLDLHTSLILRNSSQSRVRGVTLLVLAQEVTAGGKGSVSVPSLDVRGGETFPVRIDLRLLRPLFAGGGPLVRVELDGVLFEDLSFYGPNKLNSRRAMTVWELEARRDRRHFKSILEAKGPEGLQQEALESLARQAQTPRLDVQVSRRGRATAARPAAETARQFAFLKLPDAPLEPLSGMASVSGNEADSPWFEVVNRSDRPIQYFEIGWIIRDRDGREFVAGSVPASDSAMRLGPGQKGRIQEEAALRFSRRPGQPVAIDGMTGFVSQVQFSDGTIWIPSRSSLMDSRLRGVLAPSPEEQRLTDLYRRRGLAALVNELRKFQ